MEIHLRLLIIIISFFSIFAVQTTFALEAEKILNIGGAKIEIHFTPGVAEQDYKLNREQVIAWIEQSANAVTDYFQRFPVKTLRMRVTDGARNRVDGKAYHGSEPLIVINLRKSFDGNTLANDWVMVHEMVHLSFPPVKRHHHWLLEGLATYVESIVRVRAGLLSEDQAWEWLIKRTPQGLPQAGNQGLDNTPTWGQRYWGGAIFFLVADIRIHQQSNNKFGIEHALRAIQRGGGSMQLEDDWDVTKALSMGDKGINTDVLVTLYNEMRDKPVMTDLNAIWQDLGVSLKGRKVVYDNTAKLADLRRSIMNQ